MTDYWLVFILVWLLAAVGVAGAVGEVLKSRREALEDDSFCADLDDFDDDHQHVIDLPRLKSEWRNLP